MRHPQHHTGGLVPIKLALSHAQALKAGSGKQIQVAHHQMGHGHTFHVHPETHKKLVAAHRGGRGARIHITHHELAGSGFLDVLKKVASPVLSGLAGVAGELFPSHKDTINNVREGLRTATGYGIRTRKHSMHGRGGFMHAGDMQSPEHFPGMHTDHYGVAAPKRKAKKSRGRGINPSGFGY